MALYEVMGEIVDLPDSGINVDIAAKICARVRPEVWKVVHTKHIDVPHTHYPFKALAVTLTSAIHQVVYTRQYSKEVQKIRANNIGASAGLLQKFNYPTYYVGEKLFEAMRRTHAPKGMTWDEIAWPFDSLVFMLPRNTLFEPEESGGREIFLVGASRFSKDAVVTVPGTPIQVGGRGWDHNRVSVFWAMHHGLLMQDCTFPGTEPLEPSPEWIDRKTREWCHITQFPDDGAKGDFSSYMSGLVANLILVMQARKQMVETGERTGKRLGSGVPVWKPTWVGRRYEILREDHKRLETQGGHFTELDWRAGHMKRQHFGPGGRETKIILVDPYIAFTRGLVRGEKAASDQEIVA